ncbi:hypothetical protein QTL86_11205 [Cellulosilyticum sp. ST5]|uniref:hypothetical protein n=1 Tax=Cellulosilyticum sp. ST5 TaxID=3055805 RepID=UPI003977D705
MVISLDNARRKRNFKPDITDVNACGVFEVVKVDSQIVTVSKCGVIYKIFREFDSGEFKIGSKVKMVITRKLIWTLWDIAYFE